MLDPSDILKGRILIVDDQAANVAVLEQMLHEAGYTAVTSTQDSHTVCALHRQHRYDLILLDLQMPGLDGFQVMEGLREIEPDSYLPVLVITAQPDHKLRALRSGARDFISKPFDLTEVLLRVHNQLEVRLLGLRLSVHNYARLENSQRIAALGDWEHDLINDQLAWSEGVYRILGLTRKDCPPDSAIFYAQVHPDDLAFVHREKAAAAAGSRRVEFEHRIIRKDGEVRHLQQIAELILDDQGRPVRESGTIQDITDRKRAADEMREKTALLEAQIDSSSDGILVVDPRGKRILQNARYVAMMEMPPEIAATNDNLVAREFVLNRLHHPAAVLERVKYLYSHPDEASREEIELKNGIVLDRYSSPIVGREGRNYGRIWTFRDITANKAAELALRESEERFKFVARAVSDAVWDWNLATNAIWWNDGYLTAFGYGVGEIDPSFESWTSRIHPEECSQVAASIRHAIDSGVETWSAEYRFRRKDATYALVQDRGYILRDAAGKGVRMVGGLRDLTEQKKMEAQYLRAQRMESIGTLAGGIAHDLNNVLAPIMMSIELLRLDEANDARRNNILDIIRNSSQRGADLVRQVLAFARGMDGERVAIRLGHLINDLDAMISETFPRNIRIVANAPNELWPILGDPTQLHQVLLNLAVNARDAMPQGGTLTLAASNVTLGAQYAGTSPEAKPGSYVLMEVTDTGMGIPAAVRERIFEPFFTTKEPGKGTGIGLATVHTIVKSHGGFMVVESEVGQGTSFKLYLPADPALRPDNPVQPLQSELPGGRGELVLVVDDEYSIRDITKETLEIFGYRVLTARDGAEAAALYAKQSSEIALVITDMMMPGMDGGATIQVLRRMNPYVRIIAASGIDSGDGVGKAVSLGVGDFLLKPYTAEALLHLVRAVLDRPVATAAPFALPAALR